MDLKTVLNLVISSGAGGVVYWLMGNIAYLDGLPSDQKRYWSLGLAAVIPVLAWLAMLGLGYSDVPATWQGWVENAFALMSPAILVSQGMHGALELRDK